MNISSRILQKAGRATTPRSAYVCSSCTRRLYSQQVVRENDIVMLKHRTNPSAPLITAPLRPGKTVQMNAYDVIRHDDIIGKTLRECTSSKKKVVYRILEPSFAEYTDHHPRLVTPIYSQDASLIVSLLDIHPTPPDYLPDTNEDKLEIFEAGTGHGALTLHLAKAVHAANTAPPKTFDKEGIAAEWTNNELSTQEREEKKAAYDSWRSQRRAIVHTLDISAEHATHAEVVVKNFRHGLYYPHVDFNIGTIEEYLSPRFAEGKPFLNHAILDLPSTQDYLGIVEKALKPNGLLLVFCPSVTQIMDCLKVVKENDLPLYLERTVEVGSLNVGGREWDIRAVKPRKSSKVEGEEPSKNDEGMKMICRPKVGVRIGGGGFVGLFRKEVEFNKNVEQTSEQTVKQSVEQIVE